jgi:hypothetical protein
MRLPTRLLKMRIGLPGRVEWFFRVWVVVRISSSPFLLLVRAKTAVAD